MVRFSSLIVLLLLAVVLLSSPPASAEPVAPAAPNAGWLFDETYGVLGTTITDSFGSLNGVTAGTSTGTDSSTGGPQSSTQVKFPYAENLSFSTLNGLTSSTGTGVQRWHGAFAESSWRNFMSGASAVTAQVWVNYPSDTLAASNVILAAQISTGSAGLWIQLLSDNKLVVGGRSEIPTPAPDTTFQSLTTTAALTPDQWNHIVAVLDFENDKIRVALNGGTFQEATVNFGSDTFDPTGGALGTPDFISGRTPAARYIGLIDEVAIWRTALTQDNVDWLYQNSLHGLLPPSVQGDFDGDGDVDGADFVAWQTHFPTASGASLADGDADGDGDVDGADFVVWQTNFPFTPGSGVVPVPEPTSMILCVVLMGFGTAALYRLPRLHPSTETNSQ